MAKNIWKGLAIGAVIGGGAGDDTPSGNGYDGGFGGAKNVNDDRDSKNGGQGLFSLWGHEIWLYVGGIVGFGDTFGIYATTGPMIGANPDWAIGGGIHFAKSFGLGVVIPLRQAYNSYVKHQDKVGAVLDYGERLLTEAFNSAYTQVGPGLETLLSSHNLLS